jgi:hypothetical protein
MDGQRIDVLARFMATGVGRRSLVGGLAAALLSGPTLSRVAFAARRKDGRPIGDEDTVQIDCSGGYVACRPGTTCCAGSCVNLQTDEDHCGACGNACDPTKVCRRGTCVCAADHPRCGDICCLPGTECVSGQCRLAI